MAHQPIKFDEDDLKWIREHGALESESISISVGGLALRMGERFPAAASLVGPAPDAAADAAERANDDGAAHAGGPVAVTVPAA